MQIFKKFSGEHAPGTPKSSFCYLLKINSAGKKLRLKKWRNLVFSPGKNSECAPNMKHSKRAYLRSFPGLNVFVFSLRST